MIRPLLCALAAIGVMACSGPEIRVSPAGATPSPTERVTSRYRAIEVALVTMPTYATTEEIIVEAADGTLTSLGTLWPDEPARAMTLQVARDLGLITGRLVAPDPWPFRDFPDATLDIRIEDFYATASGSFRLAGQFFVAPETDGRNIARSFVIEVPVAEEGGAGAIAAARGTAVARLALDIAQNGLR